MLIDGKFETNAIPTLVSDDYSFILEKYSGAYMFLGIKNETLGSTLALHNPGFLVSF